MIAAVVAALESGDLIQAETLLQQLSPEQLPVKFAWAWLAEKQEDWDIAEQRYRELLRQDCGPKLTLQARQGLERIAQHHQAQQAQALAFVAELPQNQARGILVLTAIPDPEMKADLVQHLARIMQLELYTARTLLPSRGWRFFRAGPLGELEVYGKALQASGIPVFWLPLAAIEGIQVIPVRYLQNVSPQAQACWLQSPHQTSAAVFNFNWAEVSQRVEGLLPIFETVVDRSPRGQLVYKEQVQDHAQFCDLHLPQRQTILRFYRGQYQFHQGINLNSPENNQVMADQETSWANWRQLINLFEDHTGEIPVWKEFTAFAETIVDQTALLKKITPHIDLFRREESLWDNAFQLYSGLIFQLSQAAAPA